MTDVPYLGADKILPPAPSTEPLGAKALRAARLVTYSSNGRRASTEAITMVSASKQVGVSRDSILQAKKLIQHGDNRILQAVEDGRLSLKKAVEKIGEPTPQAKLLPRTFRTHIPPGMTPEQYFRQELTNKTFDEQRKTVTGQQMLRYIRDLFALADNPDLHPFDKGIVREALAAFNEKRQLSPSIEPIALKVLGARHHRMMKPGRRIENFRRMLISISQAADNTDGADVPFLTPEQIDEATRRLADARRLLGVLERRIKEESAL
jgi:hypothetical protein